MSHSPSGYRRTLVSYDLTNDQSGSTVTRVSPTSVIPDCSSVTQTSIAASSTVKSKVSTSASVALPQSPETDDAEAQLLIRSGIQTASIFAFNDVAADGKPV